MKRIVKYLSFICLALFSSLFLGFGVKNLTLGSVSAVGDGVYVTGGAKYTMDGGKISGRNNGVYITGDSTFNMTAGTISGNNCGVYLDSGTFNYSGGTISDEIYLASGTYITLKAQPNSTFSIRMANTAAGQRVARLNGISSITLSRLNVTNLPDSCDLAVESGYVVIKAKTFTVTIVSNNSNYGSVSRASITGVPYGASISASTSTKTLTINGTSVTAKPEDGYSTVSTDYYYTFDGWSYSGTTVTGDMTITATFSEHSSARYYTVYFDVNNSSYGSVDRSSISVPYGSTIRASSNTITIGSETVTAIAAGSWSSTTTNYYYDFSSWSITSGTITESITITATFTESSSTRYYTVYFRASDTSLGSVDRASISVTYNASVRADGNKITVGGYTITATAKDDTAQYHYEFTSWSKSSGNITSSITITANFTSSVRNYTVTFDVNDSTYGSVDKESISVPYGSTITTSGASITINKIKVTATPAKNTADYEYAFSGWTNNTGTISGDRTITANFTRTEIVYYNVTLRVSNGSYGSLSASSARVVSGSSVTISGLQLIIGSTTITASPSSGYMLASWTRSSGQLTANITSDVTFTATFGQKATINIEVNGTGAANGEIHSFDVAISSRVTLTIERPQKVTSSSTASVRVESGSGIVDETSTYPYTLQGNIIFIGWLRDTDEGIFQFVGGESEQVSSYINKYTFTVTDSVYNLIAGFSQDYFSLSSSEEVGVVSLREEYYTLPCDFKNRFNGRI